MREALVRGVLGAAAAKWDSGALAAIGFAAAPEVDPAASGFWTEVGNLGGRDFAAALHYAGIVTHWELFTLRDADSARDGLFYHFGIMRDDYSRKPAFARLQTLIAELGRLAPL